MWNIPGPVILDLNTQRDLLGAEGAYPVFQAEKLIEPLKTLFSFAHKQMLPVISPGYGFTAIMGAFLGRLHPLGVLLGGLVLALSYLGGEKAQIDLGLPNAVTGIYQGILLFFLLAADLLIGYRIRFTGRRIAPQGGRA